MRIPLAKAETASPRPTTYRLLPHRIPPSSSTVSRNTVENVYVQAAQVFRTDAHGNQRGAMVSQLLFEVESWSKEGNITALNV